MSQRKSKRTNAERMDAIVQAQLTLIEQRAASGQLLDLKDIEALRSLSAIMKDLATQTGGLRQGKGFNVRPDNSSLTDEELEAYSRGE